MAEATTCCRFRCGLSNHWFDAHVALPGERPRSAARDQGLSIIARLDRESAGSLGSAYDLPRLVSGRDKPLMDERRQLQLTQPDIRSLCETPNRCTAHCQETASKLPQDLHFRAPGTMVPWHSGHFGRRSGISATISQPIGPRINPRIHPNNCRPRHLPIRPPTRL